MSPGERLACDFVLAARRLAAGDAEAAMWSLLPARSPLEWRLPAMVVVGCLLAGALTGARDPRCPAAGPLVAEFVQAAAAAQASAIRDLIAAHHGEELVDVLVGLVTEFVARDETCWREALTEVSPRHHGSPTWWRPRCGRWCR